MRDSLNQAVSSSIWKNYLWKFFSSGFLFYLCTISLLVTGMANGQSGKISGFLYDSETEDPLPAANIFLSKTTLGTTSDQSGYFELKNIPPGQFTLVFRFVGYTQKSFSIEVQEDEEIRVNDIHLDPDAIELKKIDVTSSKPVEWMRNLEQFKNAFLGETENASRTEIKNPEILNFYKDPDNGDLIAESPEELHVVNRALGYELFITLDSFSWSTREETGGFYFKARIVELDSENGQQKNEWEKNRLDTFHGSFRHFLQSLVRDEVKKNFKFGNGSIEFIAEGKGRYADTYIYQVKARGEALHVQNGLHESGMEILDDQWLLLDSYGNLKNPDKVGLSGYWSTHRIADFLPFDYQASAMD